MFTSVIHSLEDNPERRFTFSGISDLYRWYQEQNDSMKERMKKLVNNHQVFSQYLF